MGIYTRPRSPYWQLGFMTPGGRVQQSTRIRHDAPTPELRRENRRLAEIAYHQAVAEAVRRQQTGAPVPKPARTFEQFAAWYETHKTPHKRGAAREREILASLTRALGPIALADLTPARLTEWMTTRRQKVSAATVNRELDVLKVLLAAAVPAYLAASPAAGLKRLRIERRAMVTLSREDEQRILAVLPPADQAIIIAALDTLLRASDLLRLTWAHDHGTHLDVPDPKTGKSYKVPVSTRLRAALRALRPRRLPDPARTRIFAHRCVAASPRHWSNSLKQMLEDACRRAKVRYGRKVGGVTFHGLRHTGASRMVEQGHSLRTVQELGGWSDLRQLTRYLHPTTVTRGP